MGDRSSQAEPGRGWSPLLAHPSLACFLPSPSPAAAATLFVINPQLGGMRKGPKWYPDPPQTPNIVPKPPHQHPPGGTRGDSYKTLPASAARKGLYFLINTIISLQSFYLSPAVAFSHARSRGEAFSWESCRSGGILQGRQSPPHGGGMGKRSQDAAPKG